MANRRIEITRLQVKSFYSWLFGVFVLVSCNAPDRVLEIPVAHNNAPQSINNIKDYPDALAAIVPLLIREMNAPAPQGQVLFYSDAGALQSALTAELRASLNWPQVESRDLRRIRHQREFDLFKFTLTRVTQAGANTIRGKVFVAEWVVKRLPWEKRVRILAHELTHVVQYRLAEDGMRGIARWLLEGFADLMSFKVVESLGSQNFFNDQIRQACDRGMPNIRQLSHPESWEQSIRALGYQSVYAQAACAVNYLASQKGIPSILEYFRLFSKNDFSETNFETTFGQTTADFDQELRAHLETTSEPNPLISQRRLP